jgi:ferrous iron transport protein A
MYLSELAPFESARVISLRLPHAKKIRLMELGLIPGETVTLHRTVYGGDPLVVFLCGYRLLIPKADASCITVRKTEKGATSL